MQMALTRRRAQTPFSLEHVDEVTGDNVLQLMWAVSNHGYRWTDDPPALRAARRLAGGAQPLGRLDLLAANHKQHTLLMQLAALVSAQQPRHHWGWGQEYHEIPVPGWITALPMDVLQAWQQARAPLIKSVLPR